MPKRLTDDQITAYHRDGFVAPIDIFAADEIAAIRTEIEHAEQSWPQALDGPGRNNAHLALPVLDRICLLYTSPSPRDRSLSRMPSSA